jgi:PiT family inorganic phosphate transporter
MSLPLFFNALLAFYVAWSLGANDVANSMGTSVGSKVLTLSKAILIAGILEFIGAVIFGHGVSETLATEVANPAIFAAQPRDLLLGMVAVLIASGLWLQIATFRGLPVASSHSIIGAIAGFSWLAVGKSAIDWSTLGQICLAWLFTPLLSGLVAALFYSLVKHYLLDSPKPMVQLREWIPWLSALLFSVFGIIVLPTLFNAPFFDSLPFPHQDLVLISGAIAVFSLTINGWNRLEDIVKGINQENEHKSQREGLEKILGTFQVISACFVAFAHGSNDVGNAIAPLAVIDSILRTKAVPLDDLNIPLWILILGGLGIVSGLAVQGKKVIATVGEGIIPLQPSSGFCAEIATAVSILLASSLGLPVSTSHALVGSVVGIGIVQRTSDVRLETVKSVVLAWVITLPISAILGAASFFLLKLMF